MATDAATPGRHHRSPGRSRRDLTPLEQYRLEAAALFEGGATQADVVRALGVSRQSASRWHRSFLEGGAPALRSPGRQGRRPRLSVAQRSTVEEALLEGARAHGFATDLWTLARAAVVIERLTGVAYHPGHVWRLLRQMGWSSQRPVRQATERDDEAIAHWVTERWPRIKRTPGGGGRGSSSSTSPASR